MTEGVPVEIIKCKIRIADWRLPELVPRACNPGQLSQANFLIFKMRCIERKDNLRKEL